MFRSLRAAWDGALFTAGYEAFLAAQYGEAPLPRDIRALALRLFIRDAVRALICKVRGHALASFSDIGPDSGSETHYCERCGWSHSHIYY